MFRACITDFFDKNSFAQCKIWITNEFRNGATSSYFSSIPSLRKQANWKQLKTNELLVSSIEFVAWCSQALVYLWVGRQRMIALMAWNFQLGSVVFLSAFLGFSCHILYGSRHCQRHYSTCLPTLFWTDTSRLFPCASCYFHSDRANFLRAGRLLWRRGYFQVIKIYNFDFFRRASVFIIS